MTVLRRSASFSKSITGRKVILLIDEYDVPLDKAFQNGYYDEMVNLIRSLFDNGLKTNDSLYFADTDGMPADLEREHLHGSE